MMISILEIVKKRVLCGIINYCLFRLGVRTPPSQGDNAGSNPARDRLLKTHL